MRSVVTALSIPTFPNASSSSPPPKLGWVSQPNQRGSIDIIWSCITTLVICCWVMLHLNVPAKTDSFWTLFLRRARWLMFAVLSPELVMLFACGQWASAKRSVAEMQGLGHNYWTMIHAFYADSGGLMLRTPDCVPFPITAKQVHYLVQQGYMQVPTITREEIWDKSKADLFAKTIASFQAAWLVAQVIARGVQHLPVTLLELSTVALITCTGAAMFFWFWKPLNVDTPTVLDLEIPIAEVLIRAGDKAELPFQDTPMDFIEPNLYTSCQLPLGRYWGVRERPLPRLPNDRDSRLHNLQIIIILAIPTSSFSLLYLIGWNFDFPIRAEQMMWRWTCISMVIILGVGCFVEAISIVVDGYTTSGLTTMNSYKLRWPTNLLFLIPGFLYMSARLVVIVEVIISLRLLPPGCFEVVQWSALLPHL
ncbi:hypothetical protein MMC28_003716 [Mycoblastus sanguinarius]|nr:hypothetical protein [Mycoblastus sanguinarius]